MHSNLVVDADLVIFNLKLFSCSSISDFVSSIFLFWIEGCVLSKFSNFGSSDRKVEKSVSSDVKKLVCLPDSKAEIL